MATETLDSGDGWLKNDVAGDAGATEHDIFRASFVFQPSDNFEAIFRWEHSEAEQDGQTTEIVNGNLNLPGDAGTPAVLTRALRNTMRWRALMALCPSTLEVKIGF